MTFVPQFKDGDTVKIKPPFGGDAKYTIMGDSYMESGDDEPEEVAWLKFFGEVSVTQIEKVI